MAVVLNSYSSKTGLTADRLAEIQRMLPPDMWARLVRYLRRSGRAPQEPEAILRLDDGTLVEFCISEAGDEITSLSVGGEVV